MMDVFVQCTTPDSHTHQRKQNGQCPSLPSSYLLASFPQPPAPSPASFFSPSALRSPSDPLLISLPCRTPVPFGLLASVSCIEYPPPNDNHVGAFFQNDLPRTPPSLAKPIASTVGLWVFRFETLSAIGGKADTRREIHESVLRRRVQRLLRDKADDKIRVFSRGR